MKNNVLILSLLALSSLWVNSGEYRPERLEIAAERYEVIYPEGSENGSTVTAELVGESGGSGRGIFVLGETETLGTLYLDRKSFSVRVSADGTNVTEIPRPGEIDCHASLRDAEDQPLGSNRLGAYFIPSEVVVDMIAFYTPAARLRAGSQAAVRGTIELAVAEANQVFRDSGTPVVLRLVYSGEVPYTEAESIAVDLERFSTPGDGFMETVQGLKSQYKADIASLFVASEDPANAGMGYILTGSSKRAYNVVKIQYAAGYYILPHEIGHNFGCAHDRQNAPMPGAANYSYGYRFQAGTDSYRTVMAYEPGQRVGYFSTPLKSYRGVPLGTATEDNARTIRERAVFISQIEIAPVYVPAPPLISQQPQSLTVSAGTMISLKVGAAGRAPISYQWFKGGAVLPGATNAIYGLGRATAECEGAYSVRVTNPDGTALSNPAMVSLLVPAPPAAAPPDPAPAFLQLRAGENGELRIVFQGIPGRRYNLQASGDMVTWTSVRAFVLSEANTEYVESDGMRMDRRFYRILLMN